MLTMHHLLLLVASLLPIILVAIQRVMVKQMRQVYLVDFSCFKPLPHLRVPFAALMEHLSLIDLFDKESVEFMGKVIRSSGLGEQTSLPPSLHYIPPKADLQEGIEEARMVLFPVMDDLFSKTRITPADVDILVLNCSAFCPSPSLSSMVVNRYGMRKDVKSFNLSGMGCSAGVIGLDLARHLLRVHPNSYAIVFSTEILSVGWYSGKDRRKLLLNCVFRMGAAAALLTNRTEAEGRCKYKLIRMVRTQRSFDDASYKSGMREEDSEGITGFSIDRDILRAVREIVRSHLLTLGASILPMHEKVRYAIFLVRKKWASKYSSDDEGGGGGNTSHCTYHPRFGSVIQHYCTPASGLTLVRELGKVLGLSARDLEPATATLRRFGNQSSSSIWYQMAYLESKERVNKGDRVWHLGFGSGTKCCSAVWECTRGMGGQASDGPWH